MNIARGVLAGVVFRTLSLQPGGTMAAAGPQAPAAQSAGRAERTALVFLPGEMGLPGRVRGTVQEEPLPRPQRSHANRPYHPRSGRMCRPTTVTVGRTGRLPSRSHSKMSLPSPRHRPTTRLRRRACFRIRPRSGRKQQRRFEILDAHWDVPLNEVELDK